MWHCEPTYFYECFLFQWRDFAKEMDGVIRIGAVNCGDNHHLCRSKGINSYPSLFIYRAGQVCILKCFIQNITRHIRLCTAYSNPTDVTCVSSMSILTILFACRDQRSLVGTVLRTTWSASPCSSSQRLSLSYGKVHSFSLCCLWKSVFI